MRTIARQRSVGLAFSWLAVLFLLFDSAGKLLQVQPVIDGTLQLGYLETACSAWGWSCSLAWWRMPFLRTSALGAMLLTGYLGGAVATHVRVSNPLFSHVLFPTYVAALLWGGLILRDARLRVLLPIRRAS